MCVYVCVLYVYVGVCICVYVYICIYTYVCMYVCICIYSAMSSMMSGLLMLARICTQLTRMTTTGCWSDVGMSSSANLKFQFLFMISDAYAHNVVPVCTVLHWW